MPRLSLFVAVASVVALGCGARTDVSPRGEAPADAAVGPTGRFEGMLLLIEGNCFPVPPPGACRRSPLSARVAAFEVVRVQRGRRGVVLPEPEVVSTLVASTVADATGHYALDVPPGRYTVLVEHEDEWFPRIYSGADDTWHAQEATAGATVTLDMRVDRATH